VERSNEICQEFAFWHTDADVKTEEGGYYELRSYRLKVSWEVRRRRRWTDWP
jgi:hypothetical protein